MKYNKSLILNESLIYHNSHLEKYSFPSTLDNQLLLDSSKTVVITNSQKNYMAFYLFDNKPQLPGLEYPVIKNLTIFGKDNNELLIDNLKSISNTFFVIVESYNQPALEFIRSLEHKETYFCQLKMLSQIDSESILESRLPEDISVRNFVVRRDEECYSELYNSCLGFLGNTVDKKFVEELEKRPSFDPDGYFIAEKGCEPVGMLSIEKEPWGKSGSGFGYIFQVGVTDDAMGSGIAGAMMGKAKIFAIKNRITHIGTGVRESNTRAVDYFKKHDFQEMYKLQGYLIKL